MSKLFGLGLVIVLLVGNFAGATETRVTTLGEVGFIQKDVNNIWFFPQTLTSYQNMTLAEIKSTGLTKYGAHFALGSGTLALYLSTDKMYSNYAPTIPDQYGAPQTGIEQKIDLFYARNVGGWPVGLVFSLYGRSYKQDTPINKTERGANGFQLVLGGTYKESLESYFLINGYMWTDKDSSGATASETKGSPYIEFGSRYYRTITPDYTLIPHLWFSLSTEGKKAGGTEVTNSYSYFNLGCGNNLKMNDLTLLVSDVGVQINPGTIKMPGSKVKYSMTYLPYIKLGLESPLSKKVTFRLGAVKRWKGASQDADGSKTSFGFVQTQMYLGAGFHFGGLDIDANMDPGLLTRGPYLLSGTPVDLASQVSLKYTWGK